MKNRKFFFKNLLPVWALILLLSLVFYFLAVNLIKKARIEEQVNDLSELALAIGLETNRISSSLEDVSWHEILRIQASLSRTRISLIKPDGSVVFDTEKESSELESHRYRPEVNAALKGEKAWSIRFSDTLRKKLIYVAVPVKQEGEIIGVLRVSRFLDVAIMPYQKLRNSLLLGLLAITLLGWLLAYCFLVMSLRPLEELTRVVEKAGHGEEIIIRHSLHEAIGPLASGLEALVEEMKKRASAEAEEKEMLNSLFTATEEGWLVVEENGKILMTNPALRKMFPQLEAGGEFFWETLRCPSLIKGIEEARQKNERYTDELEIAGRIFKCQAIWLASCRRYLINFRDITEVKNLARQKKEFMANLIHELKTPLTALNGFIETLEEEDLREEARHYLSIIKRNTERLVRLVEDLSHLSELEEKEAVLEKEAVNLAEIVDEMISNYEKKAWEKGLDLKVEIEGNTTLIADRFQMEQLVLNLLDNAIRYTEKGGIYLRVKEKEGGVVLEVEDTGLGIPEEHLSRIFERFYVVDKSRSRKTGGTGLGLAIVKHIVQMHQGNIQVKSSAGVGSTFTVWLPRQAR
ncbi:MAG: GHKL domain-containing protein [Candidatus Aminicenantes bacterium]|nr:GHKL domain-containing protein [Candidatus Aminicenantes bacterium]